jgi:glyoxylase-like metal-dependent hydrolase (beta-lactamase superfamily II)
MKISENLYAFVWMNPTANNCNAYFIDGEKKILVDPGHHQLFGHVEDELSALSLSSQDIDIVIITHGHPDHMEGIKIFADTSTLIAIHASEMDFIRETAPHYGEALGISNFEPDILLQEGDLKIGDLTFQVIHTPGHSPGSICLYWTEKKALFTGDVVFSQGIGRTDLPGGSGQTLKESIKKISRLEADYLLPGHGEILSDPALVKSNFSEIEKVWFAYL